MNPAAILGLISDLYLQVATLTNENTELRKALAERSASNGFVPEPEPAR